MENQKRAVFVKHRTTNNIVVITNVTRKYFEKMAKVDSNYILLDEYEQVIVPLELTPQEAEIYVEQKLVDLQEWHDRLTKKEIELNERELNLNRVELKPKVEIQTEEIKEVLETKTAKKSGRPKKDI